MDSVHCPDERTSISELVSVTGFLKKWTELLLTNENDRIAMSQSTNDVNPETLAKVMGLSTEIIEDLESVCSVNALESGSKASSDSQQLSSLRITNQVKKKCQQNRQLRQALAITSKYRFFDPVLRSNLKNDSLQAGDLSYREVLLVVNVYQPYKKNIQKSQRQLYLKIEQEITVLGSQFLTDLRDKITCLTDITVPGDFSENPDLPQDLRAKDVFTGGFFYINGVFYNDTRDLQSRDYSKVIIGWVKENPDLELGPFEQKKMQEATFLDLQLRLGYPYVYQHQGDCEHLIIFQDLRMICPNDCQDPHQYPLIQSISRRRRVICMICHMMTAKWVTNGNDRLAQEPFFFCDGCFRLFNYNTNGKKIGRFYAHPFIDRSALM